MFSARARSVAWPLFGYFFFFCSLIGTMVPYISMYYRSIDLSGSEIGRIMSLLTLSTIIVPHFWGWLTTRLGLPKLTLQIATGGTFIAVIPFYFAQDYGSFWVLTFILALFYSALMPLADSLALRSIKGLGVPYTRIRVGGSLGYICAVTLCGFLISKMGVEAIIPLMMVFITISFAMTFLLNEKPIPLEKDKQTGSFLSLLKQKEVRFFLLLAFLSYMAHAPYNLFIALHMSNAGYSGEQIGLLISFGVVMEIVLFLFFGNIVKRFSVVYIVALCFGLGIFRWILVGWYVESLWIVLITQLTHCITFALFHMVSIEQIHRLFPEKYAAQGQTMYSAFAIGLGGGSGMILSGYIWEMGGGMPSLLLRLL
ncbi:MFS transporter [Marinomonas sp. 15G1-11]|uniref:MFS transporter n=1 Tax=Marinomonas phaeophyticola TaxID=3004091 RepID=A0ABT4JV05_9GAMM|nr:MFS transporter [Marinomonas sp. 15G1-11]MCZ2722230.1 MFS transporter [Marinomonas sp. 15G1-11]